MRTLADYRAHWANLEAAQAGGAFITDEGKIVPRRPLTAFRPEFAMGYQVTTRMGGTTDQDVYEKLAGEIQNQGDF